MKDRDEKTEAQLAFHKKGRKQRKRNDHRMVHKLVRKTAQEMAAAYYENAAHDNAFYHFYPSMKFFVDYEWHRFIVLAKRTLADLMANPNTPDAHKQDIYHALLLDATLPYSTQEGQFASVSIN
jgi:hypothetical protein